LITCDGKPKEAGEMHKKHEEVFGVDVFYFKEKVDFVQVVKLKASSKTKLSGSLEYMACNDEQCLPPATVPFSIALE
jgi:thiol:disulfide interchange protein DsbD